MELTDRTAADQRLVAARIPAGEFDQLRRRTSDLFCPECRGRN